MISAPSLGIATLHLHSWRENWLEEPEDPEDHGRLWRPATGQQSPGHWCVGKFAQPAEKYKTYKKPPAGLLGDRDPFTKKKFFF